MSQLHFASAFEKLTENPPFPWQTALYERFITGEFPSCNLPTGLGKTSVVAIWLIALANYPDKMPRRLVYVVNRRTVVDQTTNEVEKLRANLPKLNSTLDSLALSTLRGQFADNREWSADPSRPAVICGTVDMIGSRLLFSGYGVGFKAKPLHAGFLGQDVLLVHDEAHLEPAFQKLLVDIESEQKRCNEFAKFRVMELSATSRSEEEPLTLTTSDYEHPEVKKRIGAKKAIHFHENRDPKKLAEEIAALALRFKDSQCAVLVFAWKVEDVEKIVNKLSRIGKTEQLTGTLRGKERDELVNKPNFRRFLPKAEPGTETVYLVCTSAGEVGVNISADHLVCDLSTFDSMAQRFGRVNRFGDRDDTEIHIVTPQKFGAEDEYELRLKKTYELLKELKGDGSPKALSALDAKARRDAFAPDPKMLPASDILFDAWALTSIRDKLPGRPPVEPYLHGISNEIPETQVAWRDEVGHIKGDLLDIYDPKYLLEDYPLKPHELLRDNAKHVYDRLKKLTAPDYTPVWIVSDDDSVQPTTLGELRAAGQDELNYKTVLLPPKAGGLENGMLKASTTKVEDVADEWCDEEGNPRRCRNVWDDDDAPEGMRLIREIDTKPNMEEEAAEESTSQRYWRWYETLKGGDSEGSRTNKQSVTLKDHTEDVVTRAEQFLKNLSLPQDMKKAILLAAKFHDRGKRRVLWQRSIGNPQPDNWLAKSGRKMKLPHFKTDYRHEFGSLVDVLSEPEFQNLDDDMKELVLHLIAAHHGRGRPHFPADEVFDPEAKGNDVAAIASEVPQRFARLQRKYGRWGLAYLESLLRAADYAASAKPSAFEEELE
jgi:CRISPR-associated endonuclease/helicase Cas3